MEVQTDVIIVGAGPAGTMAAYHLSLQGFNVLILEKSVFPRYKVCGGGLTHKIMNEIPFDLTPAIESVVYSVQFSCNFRDVFSLTSPSPLMYCTMRDQLDNLLMEKAREAGTRIMFNEKVTGFDQDRQGITVRTKDRNFRSRLLISAEGAAGGVARMAGLKNFIMKGLAWEAEIPVPPDVIQRSSSTIFLDWGTFPGGYAWVFPKQNHFSIGVGGPARLSKGMMPYFQHFLQYLHETACLPPLNVYSLRQGNDPLNPVSPIPCPVSLKSWPIPVRIKKDNFHQGRILVAGDSAGLTDPLTGEGIYYAVRSGKLAAEACSAYLNAQSSSLQVYSDQVNHELMEELLEANKIKYLFNTFPLKIHTLVKDKNRVRSAFGKVLRGERMYADVRKGLGRWSFLWGVVCFFSKLISDQKEKTYLKNG